MRPFVLVGLLTVSAVPVAFAAPDCTAPLVPQPLTTGQTLLSSVAPELRTNKVQLGAPSGVLAHAYDESQSVERVLLRLRLQACGDMAVSTPAAGAVDPNDPAAYKPKTEFDNTPWRFDMSQNGKRMTAEEFDAWMKSRGVRVARGPAPAPAAAVPAALPVDAAAAQPAQSVSTSE